MRNVNVINIVPNEQVMNLTIKVWDSIIAELKAFLEKKEIKTADTGFAAIFDEKYLSEYTDLENSGELTEFAKALSRKYKVEIRFELNNAPI